MDILLLFRGRFLMNASFLFVLPYCGHNVRFREAAKKSFFYSRAIKGGGGLKGLPFKGGNVVYLFLVCCPDEKKVAI